MKQLKQNIFWVGVVLAAAVLVAFYVLMVFPNTRKSATLRGQISGPKGIINTLKGDVPGDPDIANWNAYKERLRKDHADIIRFYEECDSHLERWFPGLAEPVGRDLFNSKYRDEGQAIEKKLQEKGVKIGMEIEGREGEAKKVKGGFNWEDPSLEDWDRVNQVPGELARVLKALQKRFWARQRMADVVLQGKVTISRVVNFRFLRRLHDRIQGGDWENSFVGDPMPPFPQNTPEFDLPEGLGRTLTFRFGVELPFSQVPKFIQEFMNPAAQARANERLLLGVPQCLVTIRGQNEAEKKFTYEKNDAATKKKVEEEIAQLAGAKDVLLVVTCQIIDFDPSKAKKFDGAAAPANP